MLACAVCNRAKRALSEVQFWRKLRRRLPAEEFTRGRESAKAMKREKRRRLRQSRLCAASASVKSAFASDLLNLTLASPSVNRHQKSGKAVVARTLEVRRKYGLTIERAEAAAAAEKTLSACDATAMEVLDCAPGHPAYRHMRDGDGDGVVCE